MEDVAISVNRVNKSFKLPHEKNTSAKSAFVNVFRGKSTFEKQRVLQDISLEIKKGEFFGVIGRNGSGKSTLMKLLAGIYSPDSGHIGINGRLTPFIELGVGFNPELTGRENVFLNGALLGFNRKEMDAMYDEIVDFAELEKFMDQKLKNYSSGMQVRLAFSIAIRAKSDILLIDEVLAVGDLGFQEKCYKFFEEIKESGRTVVFISHDGGAIEQFCNRVAIIDRSKLVDIGDPREMVLKYGAIVAGEEYHGTAKGKDGLIHKGNGAVLIKEAKIVNKKGLQQISINQGESFGVEIVYQTIKTLKEGVVVGVDIMDSQGTSILSPNTKEARKKIQLDRKGTINIQFESNPLAADKYTVTVGIFKENLSLAYDLVENIAQFKVIGEKRHGKIYIEPRWAVDKDTI